MDGSANHATIDNSPDFWHHCSLDIIFHLVWSKEIYCEFKWCSRLHITSWHLFAFSFLQVMQLSITLSNTSSYDPCHPSAFWARFQVLCHDPHCGLLRLIVWTPMLHTARWGHRLGLQQSFGFGLHKSMAQSLDLYLPVYSGGWEDCAFLWHKEDVSYSIISFNYWNNSCLWDYLPLTIYHLILSNELFSCPPGSHNSLAGWVRTQNLSISTRLQAGDPAGGVLCSVWIWFWFCFSSSFSALAFLSPATNAFFCSLLILYNR